MAISHVGLDGEDVHARPPGNGGLMHEGARPGEGQLAVGLYEWSTLERLPAYDERGGPWPDGRVLLELPDVLCPPVGQEPSG